MLFLIKLSYCTCLSVVEDNIGLIPYRKRLGDKIEYIKKKLDFEQISPLLIKSRFINKDINNQFVDKEISTERKIKLLLAAMKLLTSVEEYEEFMNIVLNKECQSDVRSNIRDDLYKQKNTSLQQHQKGMTFLA